MSTEPGAPFVTVPDWLVAEKAHYAGVSNALDEFVYHDEPMGNDDAREWRYRLSLALDHAFVEGMRAANQKMATAIAEHKCNRIIKKVKP